MRNDADQTTRVGVAPETGTAGPLTATTKVALADQADELVAELQRHRLRATRRAFQPTPPDEEQARRIVVLALAAPRHAPVTGRPANSSYTGCTAP